jgi:hypothetical protein
VWLPITAAEDRVDWELDTPGELEVAEPNPLLDEDAGAGA